MLNHAEVKLHHNLADANIALCSPSVPPLFSDNFDFQTRDDFIHGILINEEILASSLYYTLLKGNEYAAAVTNWKTYQIVWYVSSSYVLNEIQKDAFNIIKCINVLAEILCTVGLIHCR